MSTRITPPHRVARAKGLLLVLSGLNLALEALPAWAVDASKSIDASNSSTFNAADTRRSITVSIDREEMDREHSACFSDQQLRAEIAARLGYDPYGPEPELTISVTLQQKQAEHLAHLEFVDVRGRPLGARSLQDADCTELSAGIALSVAMMLDSFGAGNVAPTDDHRTKAPSNARTRILVVPQALPSVPQQASVGRPEEPTLSWRAGLGAGISAGGTPSLSPAFFAMAETRSGLFSLGLEASVDVGSTEAFSRASVHVSSFVLSLVPCYRRLHYGFCGLLLGGMTRASADEHFIDQKTTTTPKLAVGARLLTSVPVSDWLGLELRADLMTALARTSWTSQRQPVWETPFLAGLLSIAGIVELR